MGNRHNINDLYFTVKKEDGTYSEPILVKPIREKDLYADSEQYLLKEDNPPYKK